MCELTQRLSANLPVIVTSFWCTVLMLRVKWRESSLNSCGSSPITATYAGGVKALSDLDLVRELGKGRIDITVGSALDVFGRSIPYRSVVEWHRSNQPDAGDDR